MTTLLPWHQQQWQNLMARLRGAGLPHAMLFSGPTGLGKDRFAALLVQTLLCESGAAAGQPCGQCRSCLLYAADNHPDQRIVSPPEPGKAIGVDQVREANRYLTQTSQYGGYKVVIITPADQLNANAANSLLKTLEEPSAHSVILLITARPARLPATILSRCQRLVFAAPEPQQAIHWLAERIGPGLDPTLLLDLAEGAPLRALQLVEDDVFTVRLKVLKELQGLVQGKGNFSSVAEQFLKIGVQQTLYWMYNWTADMIRFLSSGDTRSMVNRDLREYLVEIAGNAGIQAAHDYLQFLNEMLRVVERQLNPQLLMENILMFWQDVFAGNGKSAPRRVT
jgi:DNA polymerase-3 subunit delta'